MVAQRLTPEQRSLRSRVAAHSQHAQGKTNTGPAREAMRRKFELQVDPDGVLPPDELAKRVEHARKAYFGGLALKSATARRKAKELLAEADQADAALAEDVA